MSDVVLKNLSKSYDGNTYVVKDFNIEINDGEFIVIVGSSGCGKTTILRMIAGLEEATRGKIIIDAENITNNEPRNRNIAFVFQDYALYPHMNVYENIAFPLKMNKVNKREIKKQVLEIANILEIDNLLKRKPRQLSGGERQRVAIGRALVRRPKVLLMDEPLSNLDAKFRNQMRREISRLHKKMKLTIIYVTHDQMEAMTLGDKIVVMKEGAIMQIDTPLNLYNNPKNRFVAEFIGSPPMNFFINDKGIEVGVRPESFLISRDSKNGTLTKVENYEELGYEALVYFKINNCLCVARVLQNDEYEIGEEIYVSYSRKKEFIFE